MKSAAFLFCACFGFSTYASAKSGPSGMNCLEKAERKFQEAQDKAHSTFDREADLCDKSKRLENFERCYKIISRKLTTALEDAQALYEQEQNTCDRS